jgi:tetratricopeptide (TPR) repeat protein
MMRRRSVFANMSNVENRVRTVPVKRTLGLMALALVYALCVVGCSGVLGSSEARDERDPMFRRAMARKNAGDVDGAIEWFNRALDRRRDLARAHFELGLLYDMKKQDYVRAIYHYQRYLELRPDADKKELVEGLIRQARISYAATLPSVPDGALEQIALLKKEVALLRSQLEARGEGSSAAVGAPVRPPVAAAKPASSASPAVPSPSPVSPPPPPPKPAPALPAMQEYVVQRGDTLSSIAAKVYRDPNKWRVIYDANRSALSSPESVKVGQTLLIPRLQP